MGEDELFVLVIAGISSLVLWGWWYSAAMRPSAFISPHLTRWPLTVIPVLCGGLLLGVLRYLAASDVRDAPVYLILYFFLGAAWVGATLLLIPLFGVQPREDIVERRNAAAAPTVAGTLLALTLCYAGGNIGDGPGWWVVVYSAALATGALLLLWLVVELATGIGAVICVHRDSGAGVRFGLFLLANGLVLGRAVAGDWTTGSEAVADVLRLASPLLLLVAVEIGVALVTRPTPAHPYSPAWLGAIPGMAYVAAAAAYVGWLGPW